MIVNNINCPDDIHTFNELVWLYGSMGDKVETSLSDNKKEVVARAWSAVAIDVEDDSKSEEEIDEIINSFYTEFQAA